MLNLCMYLDGVQISWTLLPSSGMSCYSITIQDSSQRPCDPHCSRPSSTQCAWWMGALAFSAHPWHQQWERKMTLIYQAEGQAEAVELFASSTACIICLSRCRASHQQHLVAQSNWARECIQLQFHNLVQTERLEGRCWGIVVLHVCM